MSWASRYNAGDRGPLPRWLATALSYLMPRKVALWVVQNKSHWRQ